MEQCIPKKVLPPRRRNLPWLSKSLVQSMRRRNCLFKKAKRTNDPIYKSQYKSARNRVTSQLRQAKQKHFQNLNPSYAKQFWKTIKVLNKQNVHGGSLTHNGLPCPSDTEKANSLNDFFSMCFNTSCQPISTIMTSAIDGHECPPELLCTEKEVCSLLKSIDTSKASGPDGVSARMLKSTARCDCTLGYQAFQLFHSLLSSTFQLESLFSCFPYLKCPRQVVQQILDPFPCYLY